ncbi:MAG: response regulator, partial [Proteobacteria bacterium]
LDLSKVEANRVEINLERFDLDDLLNDLRESFQHKAQIKGIEFSLKGEGLTPSYIATDKVRLRQILGNVIGNAFKFTDSGSVRVTYGLSGKEESSRIFFRIADSGIGLSKEEIPLLFNTFSQADATISRRFGGTGLGLFISKKLAALLGGDLQLESAEPGKGCVFYLEIELDSRILTPLVQNAPKAKPAPDSGFEVILKEPSKPLQGGRFLIVEDSPELQMLVARILRLAGAAKIDIASDGHEALERCAKEDYDVVLMDVQMPGMDGFETVRRLRSQNYSVPIIALTAHAMKGYREECLAVGYDDYLVKPIDRGQIVSTVEHFQHLIHIKN